MSWFRSAVSKAVEAGGKNNLTRTVWNYADSVVSHAGNAVFEGAKLIQDRIGPRNVKSFRLTVKRLEEVSVSCGGSERVQLLRRWLVALREIETPSDSCSDDNEGNNQKTFDHQPNSEESKDSPKKPTTVFYIDPGMPDDPMNFRDVFLHSQALEGIILSMILEAPTEEELGLLLELFGLCLFGDKEVHEELIKNVQDLAKMFSKYQEEVLAKREELLQYAQDAIAGLKINGDLSRIDIEAHTLMAKLDKMKVNVLDQASSEDGVKSAGRPMTVSKEALKEVLEQIRTFSKLEALLLKKKSLSNGDSYKLHCEKVDKLKVVSESLVNSTSKAEKRILDHRTQKEEALSYRVAKTNEVSQLEKDLAADLKRLELLKDDLEAELKRVNSSIAATRARLRNAREEREQFDEASNDILIHLKSKEEELARSISSCRVEADVVNRWIKFLEDAWALKSTFAKQKEKQVNGEMEKYSDHFVDLVVHLLSVYKATARDKKYLKAPPSLIFIQEQLEPSIPKIRDVVKNLDFSEKPEAETNTENEKTMPIKSRKQLEKEYLDLEAKFVTTLSVVEAMNKPFYSQTEGFSKKDDRRVRQLFEALNRTKEQFESIERPLLEIESPSRATARSPSLKSPHMALLTDTPKQADGDSPDRKKGELGLELDDGDDMAAEEIDDWEFDALDRDISS